MMESNAYLGVFLDEVDEQLQILVEQLLILESENNNLEAMKTIFRAAHTLKGSSAAMGFERMKELTHRMENVMDLVRNQQIRVDRTVIDILFKCVII